MLYVITGGSGSGKSAYAENLAVSLAEKENSQLVYIATMIPQPGETQEKITRHRDMRAGKGFETVECFTGLSKVSLPEIKGDKQGRVILLDCMSNLTANELYSDSGAKEETVSQIMKGLHRLQRVSGHVVIVTNEVCSACEDDGPDMEHYKQVLSQINCTMGKEAQAVVEVVYGIGVYQKGEELL